MVTYNERKCCDLVWDDTPVVHGNEKRRVGKNNACA